MKSRQKTVLGLCLGPLLALVLAGAGGFTALKMMDALGGYDPALPFGTVAVEADRLVPPGSLLELRLSRRVLLVVVDGLRADTSNSMPYLNELRAMGVQGTLSVEPPSFSRPGYTLIATGAGPEVHGKVMNDYAGTTGAETLFALAKKAGLRTSAIADDWWKEIVGPEVTYEHYYADASFHDPATDEKAFQDTVASLDIDQADLTLVHFGQTDVQAHDFGGASSKQYLDAALHIDELIRGLGARLDLTRDTIIVTADHGHLSRNTGVGAGHGGWEREVLEVPLVAAGAGINPTLAIHSFGEGKAVDLAPTVAALLGLPVPAHSQGRVIFQMLQLDSPSQARLGLAQALRLAPFHSAYRRKYQKGDPAVDPATVHLEKAREAWASKMMADAEIEAHEYMDSIEETLPAARAGHLIIGRLRRLPALIAGLALVASLLLGYRNARRKNNTLPSFRRLFAGAAAYLALDFAVYRFGLGATFTLGALSGKDPMTLIRLFGIPSFTAVVIIAIWFFIVARQSGRAERVAAVQAAIGSALLGNALFVISGLWWNGLGITLCLPDFGMAYLTLAHLLKAAFMAIPALILPGLAALFNVGRARKTETGKITAG